VVKRANDETYKRYREVLGKLPTLMEAGGGGGGGDGGAASTRLVQVLLGHVDPHVAASLPGDVRRRGGSSGGGDGGKGGTGGAAEGAEVEQGRGGDHHGLGFVAMNRGLNHSQLSAVSLALRATELALIHGPPGTGAPLTTTTIHLHSLTLPSPRRFTLGAFCAYATPRAAFSLCSSLLIERARGG
jgi:hypothetical protein